MPIQLTLIALYGNKDTYLAAAITQWQQLAAQALGSAFMPYDLRQIHATIIGLERHHAPAYNANFTKYRAREITMDFTGVLAYLRECGHFPFTVQLGGFANRHYPFTSRMKMPYERSFSVQGDKVVVMGWPVRERPIAVPPLTPAAAIPEPPIYPPTLEIVRRAMQEFGVLHSYHRAVPDVDNDLFFRIGMIDQKATTPGTTSALEVQTRQLLSAQRPLAIEIRLEDVYIAAYEDDQLPLSTTRIWSLADLKVTGQFVVELFK